MTRLRQYRVIIRLAAVGLLALLVLGPGTVGAAPVFQDEGRIAVVVYPDLAGGEADADCPGCDRTFDDDDTSANDDPDAEGGPLPSLEVTLRTPDGSEVDTGTTTGLANGRQVAFFTVDAPADFEVVLEELPDGWEPCDADGTTLEVAESDFDDDTGIATVEFYLRRSCRATSDGARSAAGTPRGEATVEATEAPEGTEAATDDAMDSMTKSATESPAGTAGGDAVTEPAGTVGAEAAEATVAPPPVATAATGGEAPQAAEGAIRGLVFLDANGDGELGADEPGVSDVTVRVAGDAQPLERTTAGAGTFAFPGLPNGRYEVMIDLPTGLRPTTTVRYADVEVAGNVVMGIDFGLTAEQAPAAPDTRVATGPGSMPGTGVRLQPRGGLLLALAAVVGALGVLGLTLETRLGRRSPLQRKGQD